MCIPSRYSLLVLLCISGTVYAQHPAQVERTYEGVGLAPQLGATIPLDLVFLQSDSTEVRLDTLIQRPTILTFVYHTCPMLCSLVLDGLTRSLEDVPWTPGHKYDLVTVSINPSDQPSIAHSQRSRYLAQLDNPEANWHFLTGTEEAIRSLATSVGFGYSWIESEGEYAHPAAVIFLASDGRVTRYLPDVAPLGRDVRSSLVEASEGTIGTLLDRAFLFCFKFDPSSNSYVLAAQRTMKAGGIVAAVMLLGLLGVLWRREFTRPTDKEV